MIYGDNNKNIVKNENVFEHFSWMRKLRATSFQDERSHSL